MREWPHNNKGDKSKMTIKKSLLGIGIAAFEIFVFTIILPIIIVKSIGQYQKQHANETFEPYLTHPATLEKFPRTSIVDACKIEGECLENVALFVGRINEQSADHFIEFINKWECYIFKIYNLFYKSYSKLNKDNAKLRVSSSKTVE